MTKAKGDPSMPVEDLTSLFIAVRNSINRLPQKGKMARLSTHEATYVGRILSLNVPERRITLSIEDGVAVIIPFDSLAMPATESE